MSLLLPLAAALVFACDAPTHHDGDAIRCSGQQRSMRLYGIDAPEMPGACRPGRKCTPGDPYAARDHLAALTRGREVRCEEVDIDGYGRIVARCTANGMDLGCAMVNAGHAVERYGRLRCGAGTSRAVAAPAPVEAPRAIPAPAITSAAPPPNLRPRIERSRSGEKRYFAPPDAPTRAPTPLWVPVLLVMFVVGINLFGAILLGNDARIAKASGIEQRRHRRLSNGSFLAVAMGGGGPGMVLVQLLSGHKEDEVWFSRILMLVTGLWIGIITGIVMFLLD